MANKGFTDAEIENLKFVTEEVGLERRSHYQNVSVSNAIADLTSILFSGVESSQKSTLILITHIPYIKKEQKTIQKITGEIKIAKRLYSQRV